jgi:signal transduction histidine kinase
MKVLVVDDHDTNRKLLRVTLESEGMQVSEAADGVSALAVLGREPVDAIIADILMPRMDGYRLCHEVRSSERWRHLPFIVYSSTYTSSADEKVALDFGADQFLAKPASTRDILRSLQAIRARPNPTLEARPIAAEELAVMKEYSEVLVQKLEHKNRQLNAALAELQEYNQELSRRQTEVERAREELRRTNEQLEQHVRERTAQLEAANQELEAFSFSVAHDLSAPLRSMEGFTRSLDEECSAQLSPTGRQHLGRIASATARMKGVIGDLLKLSEVNQSELALTSVNLSDLALGILDRLQDEQPSRRLEAIVARDLVAHCDGGLVQLALENLLGNAWKFTGKKPHARIEFGAQRQSGRKVFFVRDNGAGFDSALAIKLFTPFRRMHSETEFPGSGLGLATTRRVVHRHHGEIWAESSEGHGATFYFTLGEGATSGTQMAVEAERG